MFIADKDYLTIPQLDIIPGLIHGFGTRRLHEEAFQGNSRLGRFRRVYLRQVHSDLVVFIKSPPPEASAGDAMLTEQPGILLVIKTADCLPVLLAERNGKAVAAAHCGWRGTQKRLIQKTVEAMRGRLGCRVRDLVIGLGPCIGRSCYEVGEDVYSAFSREGLRESVFQRHPSRKDKFVLDLKEANRNQLLERGIPKENIFSIDLCTHCEKSLWSYRRDRKMTGRLANFVGLASCENLQ
jgi:YfiH family protein